LNDYVLISAFAFGKPLGHCSDSQNGQAVRIHYISHPCWITIGLAKQFGIDALSGDVFNRSRCMGCVNLVIDFSLVIDLLKALRETPSFGVSIFLSLWK